jgi:diphthine synthase
MLTFVGLGLWDEKDVSLRGLEVIKKADLVYAEFYTSKIFPVEKMESIYGKRINVLSREDIENNPDEILENAKSKYVVLLVGGDPMIATTHVDLRLRADERGIETKIIHSSSIYSAVPGLTGLQAYKFGRSASIPWPYGKIPETPYDVVILNRKNGLHTLLYLELTMKISDALGYLSEVDKSRKENIKGGVWVGLSRVGSPSPLIKAGEFDLIRNFDFGEPPHVLVAAGKLHFMEEESLRRFAGLD